MKRESTSKRLAGANMALGRICLNVEAYRLVHGVINDENVDRLLTDILTVAAEVAGARSSRTQISKNLSGYGTGTGRIRQHFTTGNLNAFVQQLRHKH